MINWIIKRDGTREAFHAIKINGWGTWAAKHLEGRVNWSKVVLKAVASLPEECSSQDLQHTLIRQCLNMNSWPYNRMAGRLYAATMHKEIHGSATEFPTIKQVHTDLFEAGHMVKLDYSDEEYAEVEKMIDHSRDFEMAHFQLHQIRYKYSLRNRVTGGELESPQYVYMRMAMALSETQPKSRRMTDLQAFYEHFSKQRINAPTPNYINLGTPLNGYASCCLYTVSDSIRSLAIGDHIAYSMTANASGIGNHLRTRSVGDPVRGGLISHLGKLPYFNAMVKAVRANIQNGRNGACTTFYSVFDPEVKDLMVLKNPMTVVEKQIRGMDYAIMYGKFIGRKVARDEDIFTFNCQTAPDLEEAFFASDQSLFEDLYAKYEADPNFKKKYVKARDIVIAVYNERYETGRAYEAFMDEINRHTTFKDPIYCSNLCLETTLHTWPYEWMPDLYTNGPVGHIRFKTTEGDTKLYHAAERINYTNGYSDAAQNLKVGDEYWQGLGTKAKRAVKVASISDLKKEPEVGLCSLGGIVISNIDSDEQYQDAMYYTLLMIDKCIHKSEYVLPHVGYTAKARLSAGVGMMDLAYYMAKKKLKYSSLEGKQEIHRVAETHMYHAIKASLRLAKELGNAPWIHRSKWSEGWLPIDTYNKNIDSVVEPKYERDWEALRGEIIAQGGIRNTTLIAYMPGESSSKASGTCNAIYPVRDVAIMKTDNDITVYWAAPDGDLLNEYYEKAWDIPSKDMTEVYGIIQKFTDQSISADEWRKIVGSEKISTDEMLQNFFHKLKMGNKTSYYMDTHTAGKVVLRKEAEKQQETDVKFVEDDSQGCASGACSL